MNEQVVQNIRCGPTTQIIISGPMQGPCGLIPLNNATSISYVNGNSDSVTF